MEIVVGVIGVVAAIAVVAWFLLGRGPADEEGVERADGTADRTAEQGHFGPAAAGAEPQVGPSNRTTGTEPPTA